MHSPFPGMDLYLEEPSGWPSVHHRLISVLSDTLVPQVAPHYLVSIEERVYISDDDEPESRHVIAPDVSVIERPQSRDAQRETAAVATPPTIIERLPEREVRDRFLSVYDRRSRELVTILEILSPRNKAGRSRGRNEFIAKREAVLTTNTHWIEIDLLRAGERPAEVSGQSDYYALLHRGGSGGRLEVWYFDLRDPLPRISVPLRDPHPDIVLDLQAALADVYARGRYADVIDYAQPAPPPALRPADAAWAAAQISAWR